MRLYTFPLLLHRQISPLHLMQQPPDIGYATDYINIYATGTVFVQLTLGMGAFITAQSFTKVSMVTVLIGAISNIILDPIFIFGFHMGVKGAALTTIISQAISCA